MYRVNVLPPAKEDIKEAALWYNEKQNGLGKIFINEVRSKVLVIRESPNAFAIRYDEVRCAMLDIFPFMIHYHIDTEQKTIIISAVFHTSLNPERWKKR